MPCEQKGTLDDPMPINPTAGRIAATRMRLLTAGLLTISALAATGCGPGFSAPSVDPVAAANTAMTQFDKNGDGQLDREELAACPALLAALVEYDLNGDKQISHEELDGRLQKMYSRETPLTSADCKVTLNRKPLKGANVRFVPEAFLGENTTLPANGVTSDIGMTDMSVPVEELPEELKQYKKLHVGVYRVEITHPKVELPARYNTNTELGYEVHPDNHGGSHAVFDLKTR